MPQVSDIEDAILKVIRDQLYATCDVNVALIDLDDGAYNHLIRIPGKWALKIVRGDGKNGFISAAGDWIWLDQDVLRIVKLIDNPALTVRTADNQGRGRMVTDVERKELRFFPIADPKLIEKVVEFVSTFYGRVHRGDEEKDTADCTPPSDSHQG